jgi:glycosyltransferase involved in cell wall biosynthesis
MKIIYISSCLPRPCGIATFSADLTAAIEKASKKVSWKVIAMEEPNSSYLYSSKVIGQINQDNIKDYIKTAQLINQSDFDVVSLQHEFFLYGDGEKIKMNLLHFLKEIKKPVITTFHSVYDKPSAKKIKLVQNITHYSKKVVVMIDYSKKLLEKIYHIPSSKIAVIPHGVKTIPLANKEKIKKNLGFKNKKIISTFGLIRPPKGIEYAILAMPKILKQEKNAFLLVIGQIHPNPTIGAKKYMGKLKKLAKKLKVEKYVKFITKFLEYKKLLDYLRASDIYLQLYQKKRQVASGSLVVAMSAKTAIISTKTPVAQEILGKDKGKLIPLHNHKLLADFCLKILKNKALKEKLSQNAYTYTLGISWEKIGKQYLSLFKKYIIL